MSTYGVMWKALQEERERAVKLRKEQETMNQQPRPRCTCDGTKPYNNSNFTCKGISYNDGDGKPVLHPFLDYVAGQDAICLACDADWPANTTHRCAQPPKTANMGSTASGQARCCVGGVFGVHDYTCPNEQKAREVSAVPLAPADGRTFEAWCATDEGARLLELFVRVNHLPDAQSKLRAVWERYGFTARG